MQRLDVLCYLEIIVSNAIASRAVKFTQIFAFCFGSEHVVSHNDTKLFCSYSWLLCTYSVVYVCGHFCFVCVCVFTHTELAMLYICT